MIPPVRFEFDTHEEFYGVKKAIHNAGWHMFDVT